MHQKIHVFRHVQEQAESANEGSLKTRNLSHIPKWVGTFWEGHREKGLCFATLSYHSAVVQVSETILTERGDAVEAMHGTTREEVAQGIPYPKAWR